MTTPADPPPTTGVPFWRAAALVLVVTGIVVTVGGTFGPWLQSGSVNRNSFQIVGALRRFPLIDNSAVRTLIGAWPLLGPALMIPLLLAGFRLWRSTGLAAVILGIFGLVPSVTALVAVGTQSRFGIQLITVGPLTVIAGAVLLIIGGALLLLLRGRAAVGGRRPEAAGQLPAGPGNR